MRLLVVSLLYVLHRHFQHGTFSSATVDAGVAKRGPPPSVHVAVRSGGGGGLACGAGAGCAPSLRSLPSSIHSHICAFLGADDLQALASTCAELREAATDDRQWAELFGMRFGAVSRYTVSLGGEDAQDPPMPWRFAYWAWERTWRERVLRVQGDIWGPNPQLLVHGRFLRLEQLINDHPGGAELLGNAMRLKRDVGDLFEFAAHPPRARELLTKLEVPELSVPAEHAPLLPRARMAGAHSGQLADGSSQSRLLSALTLPAHSHTATGCACPVRRRPAAAAGSGTAVSNICTPFT